MKTDPRRQKWSAFDSPMTQRRDSLCLLMNYSIWRVKSLTNPFTAIHHACPLTRPSTDQRIYFLPLHLGRSLCLKYQSATKWKLSNWLCLINREQSRTLEVGFLWKSTAWSPCLTACSTSRTRSQCELSMVSSTFTSCHYERKQMFHMLFRSHLSLTMHPQKGTLRRDARSQPGMGSLSENECNKQKISMKREKKKGLDGVNYSAKSRPRRYWLQQSQEKTKSQRLKSGNVIKTVHKLREYHTWGCLSNKSQRLWQRGALQQCVILLGKCENWLLYDSPWSRCLPQTFRLSARPEFLSKSCRRKTNERSS